MDSYDVKCPFCGKSIINHPLYKLPFEETVKRDYNIGRTWAMSIEHRFMLFSISSKDVFHH